VLACIAFASVRSRRHKAGLSVRRRIEARFCARCDRPAVLNAIPRHPVALRDDLEIPGANILLFITGRGALQPASKGRINDRMAQGRIP
jgi:hypothetical protein